MNREARTVLVTGATGFLGLHLTEALSKRGDTVIGLVHDGHAGLDRPLAHWVFGDVGDMRTIERAISDYECDAVIHLAAITQVSVAMADPVSAFEVNVCGTWNVLEACRRQKKVKRIIVASTDKVYGHESAPYTEGTPLRPDSPYEVSKACADIVAHAYEFSYEMSVAVTRSVNLYGPGHLNWSTLIPGTIKRLVEGKPPILRNSGKMSRDFLYVEDVVEGYLRLLDSQYVGPMCFGTGVFHSVARVVTEIQKLVGTQIEPIAGEASHEIMNQSSHYIAARDVLGWSPRHLLSEGLKETIPWYLNYLGSDLKVVSS